MNYVDYFNENVVEDRDEIVTICETAGKQLLEKFSLNFNDPETNKPNPMLVASCFAKIFDAFLISLEKLEKQYSAFEINVCGRFVIGYSTNQDDDDEKQGNFMVYIRHLNNSKKNDDNDDPSMNAKEKCVQWNAENITEQSELIKSISIEAITTLQEIDLVLASSECIMPIFVTVYEAIVNHLKIVRREMELFEHEINFVSCFFIGVREGEDNDDIFIRPNIESKLRLKNDSLATTKYE